MLIDIHSHLNEKPLNCIRIFNFEPEKSQFGNNHDSIIDGMSRFSVGVHPWHASEWTENEVSGLKSLFENFKVLFIGEIGLDRNCRVSLTKQKEVLTAQLAFADSLKKPVILHIVKEMEMMLGIKKFYPNIPALIIHGFRGGRKEAEQYLSKGFHLSFGAKFRTDGLLACPDNSMFVETDESDKSVFEIFSRIAEAKKMEAGQLEIIIERNFRSLFPEGII